MAAAAGGCGAGGEAGGGGRRRIEEPVPLQRQSKPVRLLRRRAAGSYGPYRLDAERPLPHQPSGQQVGLAVGRKVFDTESAGTTLEHPRGVRKAERRLTRR